MLYDKIITLIKVEMLYYKASGNTLFLNFSCKGVMLGKGVENARLFLNYIEYISQF